MKNNCIAESFRKIQPGEARLKRILDTACERARSEETAPEKSRERKRNFMRKRLIPAAACLVAAAVLSVCGFSAAAEAREYREAAAFFDANALSTEGLTRAEIREVYRDITTGRFSSEKTAEVLEKCVGGLEISQGTPAPEDIKKLWNQVNDLHKATYKIDCVPQSQSLSDVTYLRRLNAAGETVWSASFGDLLLEGYAAHGDYVAVYGYEQTNSSSLSGHVALVKADDGTILWDRKLSTGYFREFPEAIVFDGDGFTAFVRAFSQNFSDPKKLVVMKYDFSGSGAIIAENECESSLVQAVKLGDGYLARLKTEDGKESLEKIGADGKIAGVYTYTSGGTKYFVTDMKEYQGRVYLSTTAVPVYSDPEGHYEPLDEISGVLYLISRDYGNEISDEDLTKLMRDQCTAVLLVCSTESGEPQNFYSVRGSVGDTLETEDNGNLVWNVGGISGSHYSPLTSSFIIGSFCNVYRYEFNAAGSLVSQTETDKTIRFFR